MSLARCALMLAIQEPPRWPLGQTVLFATLASAGLWALLAMLVYFFFA